jgi:general secretion pathway protein D
VRIVADEVTNSLVILATKRDYQLILDVLKKVDVVPRQVVLEVMIAEITLDKDLSFGVAYAMADKRLGLALPDRNPDASIFQVTGDPQGQSGAQGLGGLLGTASRVPAQGAFAVISNRDNFNMFINALARRTNVKMLSAPHVIAADNREAHILVGSSIPILTSTQQSTLATSNLVSSVQYRDTGKILTILPQVNSQGLVNMQVRQEVSAVQEAVFGQTQSPSFTTREAETTLVVQDGETVIIGGIIDDQVTHNRSGIPYLMDVPALGRLFRVERDIAARTELILLITPYVVRSRDEARGVTGEFANRLKGIKELADKLRLRRQRVEHRIEVLGSGPGGSPPSGAPDVVPPEAVP